MTGARDDDELQSEVRRAVISGTAARQRKRRARWAKGVVVLKVEVNQVDTEEMLIAEGHLDPQQTDDRKAVEAALAGLIAKLCHA